MKRFWQWYEKHYLINLGIATALFALQLIHLYWLTSSVVWDRVFGYKVWELTGIGEWLVIMVDYTEIPALVTTSLVYIHKLKQRFSWKNLALLLALNIQVVHIFWITDEFVVSQFTNSVNLPVWLAWVAIGIDYLELPVIFDTMKSFGNEVKKHLSA